MFIKYYRVLINHEVLLLLVLLVLVILVGVLHLDGDGAVNGELGVRESGRSVQPVRVGHHGLGAHVAGQGRGLRGDDRALVRALLLQSSLSRARHRAQLTLLLEVGGASGGGAGLLGGLRLHEVEAEHVVPLDRGGRRLEVRHGDLGGPQTLLPAARVYGPDVDLKSLGNQLALGYCDRKVFSKCWFCQICYSSSAECAHHIRNSW